MDKVNYNQPTACLVRCVSLLAVKHGNLPVYDSSDLWPLG